VLLDKSSEDFVISYLRKKGLNVRTACVLGDKHSLRTPEPPRMKTVRSFETSGITNPIALCNA